MATHPDPIREMSVELDHDLGVVTLSIECGTPDLAELLFEQIGKAMEAGTIKFGDFGFTGSPTEETTR